MPKEFYADLDAIIPEWHPTKNKGKRFEDFPKGSGASVWWLGAECGHEWESKMFSRAVRGSGCPFCGNRALLPGFNDIASVHPEWVAEWSPSNEKPCDEVLSGGKPEYAWLCSLGHEFFSSVGHKERGRGCPYCANMKLLVGFNDLASVHPTLATEWHPTKNEGLAPVDVISGGRSKYWWVCSQGHEWDTTIRKRVEGSGCPVCANLKILPGFNDLASVRPEIAAEWHPTKNKGLTPVDVSAGSITVAWWQCIAGHEWETSVVNRTAQGNTCKECKKNAFAFADDNLGVTHPELASEWHPIKNGLITVDMVSRGHHYAAHWLGKCGHEWEAKVYARVGGNGCPVCRGLKTLDGFNDLVTTSPTIAAEWHPVKNGELTPEQATSGSNRRVWWQCSTDSSHEWEGTIAHRAVNGRGCPVCSGHKVVPGMNDFASVHPAIAAEWHPVKNGELTPSMVPASGGRGNAWWQCSTDPTHEWESRISGRALRGYGCPQCWAKSYISKAEQELCDFIRSLDPEMVVVQSDKKLLKGRELDVYIPAKKFAVEFNGLFWHSEAAGKGKTYHHDKWLACKLAGVQLVQVWEDDWARNPEQVKRMVAHKLGLSGERKVFARRSEVVQVDKLTAEAFLGRNHVQGFASGSYYFALVEKLPVGVSGPGNVLAVLVLRRESDGVTLNIIRYATSVNMVGGFTKLLSFVERSLVVSGFVTFADHSVSDGGLYEGNGFIADKILAPDYMYVVDGVRKHKFGYRLKKFQSDPGLLWEPNLTERELAELNGLDRVWDAGKTRYRKAAAGVVADTGEHAEG
jgi:hypothetical protein